MTVARTILDPVSGASYLRGPDNPSSTGAYAVVGSLYANDTSGAIYAKFGSADTDWNQLAATSGFLPLSGGTLTGALIGTSAGFTGSVSAGAFALAGGNVLSQDASYNYLYDRSVNPDLILGGTADPRNYYNNTEHRFRNRVGSANFLIINATATSVTGDLNATGDINGSDFHAIRASSPTTGVVYLGNSGGRYLFYDGTGYVLQGAGLTVGSVTTGAVSATTGTFSGAVNVPATGVIVGGFDAGMLTSGGSLFIGKRSTGAGIYIDYTTGLTQSSGAFSVNGTLSVYGDTQYVRAAGSTVYAAYGSETSTGTGIMHFQQGAGSSGFGGSLSLFGAAHASKPGFVVIGLGSANSGRQFQIMSSGINTGSVVYTVDAGGNVVQSGGLTVGGVLTLSSQTVVLNAAAPTEIRLNNAASSLMVSDNTGANILLTLSQGGALAVPRGGTTLAANNFLLGGTQKVAYFDNTGNRNYLYTGTNGLYFNNAADTTTLATLSNAGALAVLSDLTGVDGHFNRSASTGVVYFGSNNAHYLFFDGTNYNMPSGGLALGGFLSLTSFIVASGAIQITTNNVAFQGVLPSSLGGAGVNLLRVGTDGFTHLMCGQTTGWGVVSQGGTLLFDQTMTTGLATFHYGVTVTGSLTGQSNLSISANGVFGTSINAGTYIQAGSYVKSGSYFEDGDGNRSVTVTISASAPSGTAQHGHLWARVAS